MHVGDRLVGLLGLAERNESTSLLDLHRHVDDLAERGKVLAQELLGHPIAGHVDRVARTNFLGFRGGRRSRIGRTGASAFGRRRRRVHFRRGDAILGRRFERLRFLDDATFLAVPFGRELLVEILYTAGLLFGRRIARHVSVRCREWLVGRDGYVRNDAFAFLALGPFERGLVLFGHGSLDRLDGTAFDQFARHFAGITCVGRSFGKNRFLRFRFGCLVRLKRFFLGAIALVDNCRVYDSDQLTFFFSF